MLGLRARTLGLRGKGLPAVLAEIAEVNCENAENFLTI
jgi:hypothetical protein